MTSSLAASITKTGSVIRVPEATTQSVPPKVLELLELLHLDFSAISLEKMGIQREKYQGLKI